MPIMKQKGTYDILPESSQKWVKIEHLFRQICNLYRFQEIRTPIFESTELFHRAVGEQTDIVSKETYDFVDRGNRNLTLRPEGTAGVARSFIENKLYADGGVTKLFYIGPFFRCENTQKGRYRQFHQFGVEAFGAQSAYLDAEVIALGASVIRALGLKNVKVRINSIGDEESRAKYREVLVNYFREYEDGLCTDCLIRLDKNPLRVLDCKKDSHKDFFFNAPNILDYLNETSKQHFQEVLAALDEMGIAYEMSPRLVRGLDYYNHTVFEIEASVDGSQSVLGGGGRYDRLIGQLEGPETPAVGMSFGIDRLLEALEESGNTFETSLECDVFLITLGDSAKRKAMSILQDLRFGGYRAETDFQGRGLKSQFKLADKVQTRFTLILGEDEVNQGTINVKDNHTKEQVSVPLVELRSYLDHQIQE